MTCIFVSEESDETTTYTWGKNEISQVLECNCAYLDNQPQMFIYVFYSSKNFKIFLFLISPVSLLGQPDVVLWVQGRASGSYRRSVIREALINRKLWPSDIKLVALFFVGRHRSRAVQHMLEYEFEQFGDIVQNNYMGKWTYIISY